MPEELFELESDNPGDEDWANESEEGKESDSGSDDGIDWKASAATVGFEVPRVSSMPGAERVFDGPLDSRAKIGQKRGSYGVGGDSEKTQRTKRAKVEHDLLAGKITQAQ